MQIRLFLWCSGKAVANFIEFMVLWPILAGVREGSIERLILLARCAEVND
jgi:hypothetical protein